MAGIFGMMAPIPAYLQWLRRQDMNEAYAEYAYQIKLLQLGRTRRRWILKAPSHWTNLDCLVRQFPDLSIIQTHRDPADVLPSWIKLQSSSFSTFSKAKISAREDTAFGSRHFLRHVQTLDQFRKDHPSIPWHDVYYRDLVADPAGSAEKALASAGHTPAPEARQAMEQFIENDRNRRRDYKRSNPVEVVIDREALDRAFADYFDRHPAARGGRG